MISSHHFISVHGKHHWVNSWYYFLRSLTNYSYLTSFTTTQLLKATILQPSYISLTLLINNYNNSIHSVTSAKKTTKATWATIFAWKVTSGTFHQQKEVHKDPFHTLIFYCKSIPNKHIALFATILLSKNFSNVIKKVKSQSLWEI